MSHTFSTIARDCGVNKDQVKYAYRKLENELGQVIKGTRTFTDAERDQIVESGKFDPLALALSTEVVVGPSPFSQLAPTTLDITPRQYTASTTSPDIEKIVASISYAHRQTEANHNAALTEVIRLSAIKGQSLGVAAGQAEYAGFIAGRNQVRDELIKGEGLEATEQ